jgi:hypothetical protein
MYKVSKSNEVWKVHENIGFYSMASSDGAYPWWAVWMAVMVSGK